MIEQVLKHNNIGTKSQILYLIHLLSKGEFEKDELYQACASKEYTYSSSFDGIIALLSWLDVIKDNDVILLLKTFSESNFLQEIILLIVIKLSEEKKLHNLISNKNIVCLENQQLIVIKNYLIHLDYSCFRNLFLNIELFVNDDLIQNQFLINKELTKWFVDIIIPLIDESQLKGMRLKDLEALQIKQKKLGFEAELFVLKYEKKKRVNHPKSKNIKIISELNVNAGYDILSYRTDISILLDKYIEVKSFSGKESFFWSRNEVDVSKIKKDDYFLYLVDRSKMNNENYVPIMIQNPYENVLEEGNWQKRIEKYYITRTCLKDKNV